LGEGLRGKKTNRIKCCDENTVSCHPLWDTITNLRVESVK